MAISYPLDLPSSVGIAQITLTADNAVAISSSPFTYKQQVHAYAGQRWMADVTLPPLRKDLMEPWVAFLTSLRGQYGTFLLGDPNGYYAQGSASTTPGTPVYSSSASDGSTVTISGAPVSATGYLLAGDYIQLGSGATATLHKVLTDVDTTAGGGATIDIWPFLRRTPSGGETVVVENARGLFRLSGNVTQWAIGNNSQYAINFMAVEAF